MTMGSIDGVRLAPSPLLTSGRLVAILRGGRAEHLRPVSETLIEAGVRCLEITTNTPGALQVVASLRAAHRETDLDLGVGTVRHPGHVRQSVDAGAGFVVCPTLDLTVGSEAIRAGLRWYPGAATPTEIETAWNHGAAAVKVFPAASLGGAAYLHQVRAPLNDIPMIPTGGVEAEHIAGYLQAGAMAVGLGSPLIGDALVTGDLTALAARAASVIEAIAAGAA